MRRSFLLIITILLLASQYLSAAISVTSPTQIGKYQVWELTITHDESPYSNTWDIIPTMVLTSPTGASINVDGFYYDVDTWKVRFAPWEEGTYTWTLNLGSDNDNGSFTCNPSNEKGFVRIHPTNPYRFIYEADSSMFTAHGFGSCLGNNPIDPKAYENGSGKDYYYLNDIGGYNMDEYLDAMVDETGFNLYRWTSPNCSWALWDTITASENRYSVMRGQWGDDLVQGFRARGVRFLIDPIGFGWQASFSSPVNINEFDAIKKYYRYVIARFGAYLDIFELINEFPVSDQYINEMVTYIKSIDPYHHIITTSWANPSHPLIEMNSRHEYPDMNLYTTDTEMINLIESGANGKYSHAKPIMFDEIGTGDVWAPITFPDTTRRPSVRVRTWVSFFNEASNVYWEFNSQPARGGGLYMADDIRSDFGIYHNYTSSIPSDVAMDASSSVSGGANGSRVYGLKNSTDLYLYVFVPSIGDIPPVTTDVSVDITVPADGVAYWYDTQDGSIISSFQVTAGATTLNAPPFKLDIALKVLGGVQIDTQAPTIPDGLSFSNVGESSVELTWNAATDNVGVVNYLVYKDGVYQQTVLSPYTKITGLTPETTYSFTVTARDDATNESSQSTAVGVTTTVATYYTLTVNNGTGSGSYREGTVLTITAGAPPAGESFVSWTGDITSVVDGFSSTSIFTMPRKDASLTATYTGGTPATFTLTVNNGTGDGNYSQGTVVNIAADAPPAGQVFDIWTGDVSAITNVNVSSTTVTMPATAVNITATYKTAPPAVAINITNLNPAAYEIAPGRDVGDSIYTDRDYAYSSLWAGYIASEYIAIKTAQDDDASTGANHMSFDVDVDADVYIGIAGNTTLSWMSGWTDVGVTAVGDQSEATVYNFYKKTFTVGTVTLGGNESAGPPLYQYPYMYVVFVKPATATTTYALTVNSGSGSGSYAAGSVVNISADAPATGKQFDVWTGDVANIADVNSSSTTITMSSSAAVVTATYKDLPVGGANVVNFNPSGVTTATPRNYDSYVGTVKTWDFDTTGVPFFTTGVDQTEWYGGMLMDDTQDWWPTLDATDFFAEVWSMGATKFVANFVWLKQNFLSGFDQSIVGFDAGSTIDINVLILQGEATALRFVVKDNGQYYISETEFQGNGLHSLTDFNNNSSIGKRWGIYNPDATSFGIPSTLPAFSSHNFTDVTQIGFVVEATKSNYHHNFSFDSFAATGVSVGSTPTYTLTVTNGTGSGDYLEAELVNIIADAAPAGQVFSAWTGDVANVTDINNASTTITMPASATALTATYVTIPTYNLTVTNGTGSGDYLEDEVVNITADAAPTGQVFSAWTGDIANVADVNSASTTITMPASVVAVTATYVALPTYTLTVINGTGSGDYLESEVVNIIANSPPIGQEFDAWIGDIQYLQSATATPTSLSMPAFDVTVTATYRNISCTAPSTVDICIVGVDDILVKNTIQWDPAKVTNATTINVYKETDIADDYILAGTANVIDGSFVDNSSDPDVQANRYKLSAENDCGDESVLSVEHKTIHLTINQGVGNDWNLMWDEYIGFTISTYNIYRGTDISNLSLLTTIAGNLNSYTDKTAPAGIVYYQIEVVNPVGCGTKKAAVVSRSNIAETFEKTGLENEQLNNILIYPNPANIFVTVSNLNNVNSIKLINTLGQIVKIQSVNSETIKFDVSDLSSGLYLLQLHSVLGNTRNETLLIK